MRRYFRVLTTVFVLCAAGTAGAKQLYVDVNGNDATTYAANDATHPWRTLGRAVWGSANRSSPSTTEAARAGDEVIVNEGSYNTTAASGGRFDPIYNPANSGTDTSPIIFRAVRPGAVTLLSSQSTGTGPIIGANTRNFIVWDGFVINERDVPTRPDTGPVVVFSARNVTIQNLTVNGFSREWADNHNAIRIEDVYDIVIRNNSLSGYNETVWGNNISAIMAYNTRGALIENNEIFNNICAIYIKGTVYGPVTIRNNLIRDNRVGIILLEVVSNSSGVAAVVRNNIFQNIVFTGVQVKGINNLGPRDITIANNTFINSTSSPGDGGAITFSPETSGFANIRIANNIMARARMGIASWANDLADVTSSYNAFFQNSDGVGEVAGNRFSLGELALDSRQGRDRLHGSRPALRQRSQPRLPPADELHADRRGHRPAGHERQWFDHRSREHGRLCPGYRDRRPHHTTGTRPRPPTAMSVQ